MMPIGTELNNFMYPAALREDEYLGENGLIRCRKCDTPRQKRIRVGEKTLLPRCLCACQAALDRQREQERKHREFLDTISKNRSLGLTDPTQRKHTFQNDLGFNPEQIKKAKRYVEHWEEFRKNAIGLILWGNVGTGKSFIAGCIANALLDKGVTVLMTSFTRLINEITAMNPGERNAYIDSLKKYQLLIIDDLGVERNSDFVREQVFHIIDSRYRSQLPMIVTTNLTLEELKKPEDLGRYRIYDRITERCIPILVNEKNIRVQNREETLRQSLALLT